MSEKKRRTKTRGNGTGCAYKRGGSWVAQVIVDWRIPADESKRLIPVSRPATKPCNTVRS